MNSKDEKLSEGVMECWSTGVLELLNVYKCEFPLIQHSITPKYKYYA